ncbi:transposase domain-containing protein, partial [Streptomyces yangpuensis]
MPSWSTRRFVLALCLFARESYEEVLRVLTSGTPGSRALARANRSSLCRADPARSGCAGDPVQRGGRWWRQG